MEEKNVWKEEGEEWGRGKKERESERGSLIVIREYFVTFIINDKFSVSLSCFFSSLVLE